MAAPSPRSATNIFSETEPLNLNRTQAEPKSGAVRSPTWVSHPNQGSAQIRTERKPKPSAEGEGGAATRAVSVLTQSGFRSHAGGAAWGWAGPCTGCHAAAQPGTDSGIRRGAVPSEGESCYATRRWPSMFELTNSSVWRISKACLSHCPCR